MDFKTRTVLEEDYSMLENWWKAWGWPAVSKDILPDNGTGGVMVEYKDKPIVAGFIYWSNSGLCWFDWVVSDPEGNKRARPFAVKFLIQTVEQMVKDAGKKCIMSISRSNSLLKIHKKLDWVVDEKPSYEMIKRIN